MRFIKLIAILASFLIYFIIALCLHFVVTFISPSSRWSWMSVLTFHLIKLLRLLLGIRVKVQGSLEDLKKGGNFVITRHISYIDGLVLGGLVPAAFVSKREIESWPIIGWVVAISGTIFIDRDRKMEISNAIEKIIKFLKQKINVFVFPEGTSSDGSSIFSFQSVFFQAPLTAGASIIPVIISYERIDGVQFNEKNKDDICWYGKMLFFQHLWRVLSFKCIEDQVTVYKKVEKIGRAHV